MARLRRHGRVYRLNENWNGAVIQPRWVVVDSEGKVSLANGKLSISGGMAAPAFNDPSLVTADSFARVAGLVIAAEITPSVTNKDMEIGWCDGSLSTGGEELHGINFTSTAIIIAVRDPGANPSTPYPYSAGQSYWALIELQATGARLYMSKDGGNTWDLIWLEPTITTSPVYGFLNNYNHVYTSDRVKIYWRRPTLPIIDTTPAGGEIVMGNSLVANDTMELDSNWASINSPTTNERSSEQAHAGTYSRKLVASAGNQQIGSDAFTTVLGTFYKVDLWTYPPATQCNVSLLTGSGASLAGSGTFGSLTGGQWNNVVFSYCEPNGGASAALRMGSVAAGTWYFDDAPVKALTFSSLLTTSYDAKTKIAMFDFAVTVGTNLQAGGVACNDSASSPANYLRAFVNILTGKAELWKCEAGTLTSLTSGNITYSAGQVLRIGIVRGTSGESNAQVGLYYNYVLVGTVQTVNLSSGYGTLVAGFRTADASTIVVTVNV